MAATETAIFILAILVLLVVAFIFGQIYATKISVAKRIREADAESKKIKQTAVADADSLKKEKLIEVQDEWYRKRQEFDDQTKNTRVQIKGEQDDLLKKERGIEQKADVIARKEKEITQMEAQALLRKQEADKKNEQLDGIIKMQNERLESIARLTTEEAKKLLMENMMEQAKVAVAQRIREMKEVAETQAKEQAKQVLIQAVCRANVAQVVESTVTAVKLPSNEMKGRIIGREGRNIRTFESISGCEVLIDDTPNTIVLSGFDPVRREIARMALESLVTDGRIHPGRIEDVLEKARRDFDETATSFGEQALFDAGIHGANIELSKLLGQLKYRSLHGQNLLQHSIETAAIAGAMAAELGVDVQLTKRAAIFHDIGYAANRSDQPHAVVGAELARKYGEHNIIQQAILFHHEEPMIAHPINVIVFVANQLSKARPGAQRDTLQMYIQRLQKIETIALSFQGVKAAYAVAAGREIRIMIDALIADDTRALQIADEIAHRIESEVEYPGQVKITVIREFRAMDMAK